MSIDFDSLPTFLRPRLRLFWGVDLVGSTSLKQKGDTSWKQRKKRSPEDRTGEEKLGPTWFSNMALFYKKIEQNFQEAWTECQACHRESIGRELTVIPEFWKSNGDDLIYSAVLTQPEDALYLLITWFQALHIYRQDLKNDNQELDIKGFAWIAGFPILNTEVVFSSFATKTEKFQDEHPVAFHFSLLEKWYDVHETSKSGLAIDYVGPSIDIGFRIASKATPRMFTISHELALILSMVPIKEPFKENCKFRIKELIPYFEGFQELKGVLRGKPYPIFWIDFHSDDPLSKAYDSLKRLSKPEREKIRDFCKLFIQDNDDYFFLPFIAKCDDPNFLNPPANYLEKLNEISETWSRIKQRVDDREKAIIGDLDEKTAHVPQQVDEEKIMDLIDKVPTQEKA